MAFLERVANLPVLGLGVSTEYEASRSGGLRPLQLHGSRPEYAAFLELGIEADQGLDAEAQAWLAAGLLSSVTSLPSEYQLAYTYGERGQDRRRRASPM